MANRSMPPWEQLILLIFAAESDIINDNIIERIPTGAGVCLI